MAHARPIICAIDDSEAARHAVRAATWLARGLDARLVLAHVFDPMGIPARPRDEMLARGITDDDLERAARLAAGRLLDETAEAVTGVELAPSWQKDRQYPSCTGLRPGGARRCWSSARPRAGRSTGS